MSKAAAKPKGTSLLELVEAVGPLTHAVALAIALDVLEPACSGAVAKVSKRRKGSRFDVANVQIGVRGRSKIVGRGNRSGIQVLLWEILAGRRAKAAGTQAPLSAVADDAHPEVEAVVSTALALDASLPDAPAVLKQLVIASAGLVGTHRDVAKLLSGLAKKAAPSTATPKSAKAKKKEPPPSIHDEPTVDNTTTAGARTKRNPGLTPRRDSSAADALDAVLSEELSKAAPDGWDGWNIAPSTPPAGSVSSLPPVGLVSSLPPRPVSKPPRPTPAIRPPGRPFDIDDEPTLENADASPIIIDDPLTMDGEELELEEVTFLPAAEPRVKVSVPPPLPPRSKRLLKADVLLVAADAATGAHLSGVLRRAGFSVDVSVDLEDAAKRAVDSQPRCVVCDLEPLGDGALDLATHVRGASPRACLAPFIFLLPKMGPPRRLAGRLAQRDVWLRKPFQTDTLVEHVCDLTPTPPAVRSDAPPSVAPPPGTTAIDGDLGQISPRTVVGMLELERRSGFLRLVSEGKKAKLTFREGTVVTGLVQRRSMRGQDALEVVMSWDSGRFSFEASSDVPSDQWLTDQLDRSTSVSTRRGAN